MKQQSGGHSPLSNFATPSSTASHRVSRPPPSMMGPKRSIASLSLGRAWAQPLPKKLDEAAANHYAGIELFHEDLEYIAKTMPGGLMPANQLLAAQQIREMCDERNLMIICLQPFMHYEGLVDRERHAERIEELKLWLRLCKVLGTDLIVIPSNFLDEGVTGDWEVLVADLREAADLGAQEEPMVRFAYEALCWATFVDTWSRSYELVLAVDRPNFGICLDTFNICGREFADPASVTGCIPDAGEVMKKSLEKMRRDVDVRKIFLVQAADAEKMREPLREEHMFHVRGQKPRMSWSRNARLFPGEGSRGAYLPALEVMRVITGKDGLGYTGWISFEVFSRTLSDTRRGVPDEHARRGKQSWEWMESELGWGQ